MDRQTSQLRRIERHRRNQSSSRVLITGVKDWICEIDENLRRITVSIENAEGVTSSTVFALT